MTEGTKILLTGRPGVGKTTLVRRVVEGLKRRAGGFYTEEIREGAKRVGFRLVTLDGRKGILAHVGLRSPHRIGRYKVDLDTLEKLGVESLLAARRAGHLVVVDEIGPMELLSPAFCRAVEDLLLGQGDVLASIMQRGHPVADRFKGLPGVELLELKRANRDELACRIASRLGGGEDRVGRFR